MKTLVGFLLLGAAGLGLALVVKLNEQAARKRVISVKDKE